MPTSPRVSIVMPVFNASKYLRAAIESMLAQKFDDFEFLLLDDASTDDSFDIARSYASSDSRVQCLRNEENRGVSQTLNRGWDMARGDLIARMDADDISEPERLEKQVRFLDEHHEVVACGAWAMDIDTHGHHIAPRIVPHGQRLKYFYWRPSPLIHPAAMFRNWPDVRYDGALPAAQDFDLWLRLGARARLDNLPEYLLRYRVHEASISATRSDLQLESVYVSFVRHIGAPISREEFLSLCFIALRVPPLHRMRAMMRVMRTIGQPYAYICFRDDVRYWREWLRARRTSTTPCDRKEL